MSVSITRVFDLLKYRLSVSPKKEFICGKINGEWLKYSTEEFCTKVNDLSRGLASIKIGKESKVAIMSANRPEWNVCDFAIMQLGAYQVPLYPTLANQDIEFILEDAEISLLFVADEVLYHKVSEICKKLKHQVDIYTFSKIKGVKNWEELVQLGQEFKHIDLEEYRKAVEKNDILTLIYTSGTTGKPKGVMLTHDNMVQNFKKASVLIISQGLQTSLSFLPLSHIFERMVVYLYIYSNLSVYYVESMDTIMADIQSVKPEIFTSVPRLLEKVYDKIMEKGKELKGIKRRIFFWAIALAEKFDHDKCFWYKIKLAVARKLVFKKWQIAFGGSLKAIISGGAALNQRLARIFWAAGIPVLEGYGLTETSPVVCVNYFGNTMFGTVGPALEGVEIKIAEDKEILVKGHNIMKGYYRRDDLTKEAIDKDGFFHTGDIGEIVNGHFLKITDRKKEIFKTAGGKYIAPQNLENIYKESPLIEQIMVLGENRKFPAALIVPEFAALKNWCAKEEIEFTDQVEIVKNPMVLQKYQEIIDEIGKQFGQWERVKRFALLPKEFTINGGELTPKLSLKRKIILDKNYLIIEKIYEDAEQHVK